MIEDLEADMTGSPKETSNTDNSAVSEEANVDESITSEAKASNEMESDINDEQNNKSYKEK